MAVVVMPVVPYVCVSAKVYCTTHKLLSDRLHCCCCVFQMLSVWALGGWHTLQQQ